MYSISIFCRSLRAGPFAISAAQDAAFVPNGALREMPDHPFRFAAFLLPYFTPHRKSMKNALAFTLLTL